MSKAKELKLILEHKKEKMLPLLDFLKKNESIVDDFNRNSYLNLLSNCKSPKEKFYALFLDSINASGGLNLEYISEGCVYIIEYFLDKMKIEKNKFYFESVYPNIDSFYLDLIKNVKFMHKKKSALLIKGLYYAQKDDKLKIFHDLNLKKSNLKIPVDVVICEILNKVFDLDDHIFLEPNRDFDLINEWAKNNFKEDYYLIENLWFWGYFNTRKVKNEKFRKIEFNKGKYISNCWFYPENDIKLFNNFKEFRDLVSQ